GKMQSTVPVWNIVRPPHAARRLLPSDPKASQFPMRACLACSMSVNESGRFCPQCGAVLAEAGKPVRDEDAAVAETQHGAESKSAASLVGKTVDGFAIEGVLGGGAFGTVYRGR